jgi:hypothetical protein
MQSRLPFYYGRMIVVVVFVTMPIGVNARNAFSLLFPPIIGESAGTAASLPAPSPSASWCWPS